MVTRLPTARKFGNRPKPIGAKVPNKKDVNFTDDESTLEQSINLLLFNFE